MDVVLNSLSGEVIPASLDVLARDGRFLDIGKIGVWTPEEVAAKRKDVTYWTDDVQQLLERDPELHESLLADITRGFADGSLQPPLFKAWPLRDAVAAFGYLAKAKNIGKIVLTMPRPSESMVRSERSYLVTGGLGALGLVVGRYAGRRFGRLRDSRSMTENAAND